MEDKAKAEEILKNESKKNGKVLASIK